MNSKRTPTLGYFECLECGERVPHASYRAACPACGGALRAAPPLGDP